MINQLRKIVAGPKNRTVTQKYDLDFTYITETVAAMAYPASGLQKTYRNSIDDVAKFLQQNHNDAYLIINVSNRRYDYKRFKQRVKQYLWLDHQAPTLYTLFQISYDSFTFLKNPNHIVCFHCNHGKGRTGTAIISLFLFLGFFQQVDEALTFYNKRRFNGQNYGVSQPCQIRSMEYFNLALKQMKSQKCRNTLKTYRLFKIQHSGISGQNHQISIYQTRNQKVKHNGIQIKQKQTKITSNFVMMGDIYIQVKQKGWMWSSVIARANINLNFCEQISDREIVWVMGKEKVRIDKTQKQNFSISFYFQQFCKCDQQNDLACPCQSERSIQLEQWNSMKHFVKQVSAIQKRQICKMLYPSQVVQVSEQEKQSIG